MARRLSGQNCKFLKFFNFSLFIPKRDLNTRKTTPNIEVCPESLGAMLEYWYIELTPVNIHQELINKLKNPVSVLKKRKCRPANDLTGLVLFFGPWKQLFFCSISLRCFCHLSLILGDTVQTGQPCGLSGRVSGNYWPRELTDNHNSY